MIAGIYLSGLCRGITFSLFTIGSLRFVLVFQAAELTSLSYSPTSAISAISPVITAVDARCLVSRSFDCLLEVRDTAEYLVALPA